MDKKDNCEYLVLDGMPVVKGPDEVMWVFARSNKNWMRVPENDIWNVVYTNWGSYWDDLFKGHT